MRELKFSKEDTLDRATMFKVAGVPGDVSLHKGYKTEDDGIIYGLQVGIIMKGHYTEDDIKHRERMNNYEPIQNNEEVLIDGKVYKAKIKGDYSDCVIFEPVGLESIFIVTYTPPYESAPTVLKAFPYQEMAEMFVDEEKKKEQGLAGEHGFIGDYVIDEIDFGTY